MVSGILFIVLIAVTMLILLASSEWITTLWRHRIEACRFLLMHRRDPAAWAMFINARHDEKQRFFAAHRSSLLKTLGQLVLFMLMVVLVLVIATGNSAVFAHHGLTGFDTSHLIAIEGKVIEYRLRDPHSLLVVEGMNADGTLAVWEIEGGAGSGIVKAGLSREFLDSQPAVRVSAYQSSDGICGPRCKASGQDFNFDRF